MVAYGGLWEGNTTHESFQLHGILLWQNEGRMAEVAKRKRSVLFQMDERTAVGLSGAHQSSQGHSY